ncbi:hypothetical protein [Micromonospora sp. WMMD1219]|uniref:hypothetical protein n=1 Tax=Micromonospora sp. WMMD1219 TaxID=3404115 RepID=UPI003BF4606C
MVSDDATNYSASGVNWDPFEHSAFIGSLIASLQGDPNAADYNPSGVQIDVNMHDMYGHAAVFLASLVDSLQDDWLAIANIWDQLKIGWVGESADAADAFNTRLEDVQQRLFGTPDPDNPTMVETPGILDQVRYGAMMAAANYNSAEHTVTDMFNAFLASMSGEMEGEPQDSTMEPITVDYTANPIPAPPKSNG